MLLPLNLDSSDLRMYHGFFTGRLISLYLCPLIKINGLI
jgi:hypothetical protein